jgi:HlyD family secretion protein
MQNRRRILIPLLLVLAIVAVLAWYWLEQRKVEATAPLSASGTVEAVEINVSPELSGRVMEVLVDKGDLVQAGDPLFRLDDQLLKSQRQSALTGLDAAKAGLDTAQSGLAVANTGLDMAKSVLETSKVGVEIANNQYQIVLDANRLSDQQTREKAWEQTNPTEFEQPVWYFEKSEEITAAEATVADAKAVLDAEQAAYDAVIQKAGVGGLSEAADRLIKAEAAFLVAKDVLDRANAQSGKELKDYAQSIYDSAKSELDAAQTAYANLLSSTAATDIKEARARLSVAQARYDIARDRLNSLLIGEDSLQVQSARLTVKQAEASQAQAETGVKQAEANVSQAQSRLTQAQKAVDQAQAQLDLIDVQLSKLVVYAAETGVITTRNIEPGEVVQPGAIALVISQLDRLTITVYLPEDRYGQLKLGDQAEVTVDSFPNEKFTATVKRIADQAEFTPRNVQTVEGRRTTVFAVELKVDNPDSQLKPGMPADVVFNK